MKSWLRVVAAFLMVLCAGSLPARAGDLAFDEDGSTFASFGPNQRVTIAQGFLSTFCKDAFFATADVYVVTGTPSLGTKLQDASGFPNTVFGAFGGFFSDTIGFTAPAGKLGAGKYTIIYDECQDGTLDLVDSVFPDAFEVVIPAELPAIDNHIQALKAQSGKTAARWQRMHTTIKTLEDLKEAKEAIECVLGGVAGCLASKLIDSVKESLIEQIKEGLGLPKEDPKDLAKDVVLDTIAHYRGIEADPPDPDFRRPTVLTRAALISADGSDGLLRDEVALGNAAATEAALAEALLGAIERYKGADLAGDGTWALLHARETATYSRLLAAHYEKTDAALVALQANVAADPLDLDALAALVGPEYERIATSGFNAEESAIVRSLGLTRAQIALLAATAAERRGVASFTRVSFLASVDDLLAAHAASIPVLETLAAEATALAEALAADPAVIDGFPTASAGGPYVADEGAALTLGGSATDADGRIRSAAWDLDADGVFDDASGLTPTVAFPEAFSGLVGLLVLDDEGKPAVAYAQVGIADTVQAPQTRSFAPASASPGLSVGSTQTFAVEPFDPDDDALTVAWTVDGAALVPSRTVFSTDFESGLPAEVSGEGLLTGVQGYQGLGRAGYRFGGQFLRGATREPVTLTLTGLPPHTAIDIDFLLAVIDSWDGTGSGFPSGDFFEVAIDGAPVFSESFENSNAGFLQTYSPAPAVVVARKLNLGFTNIGAPGGFFNDSAYDMSAEPRFHRIPHTSSTLSVTFRALGDGFQGGLDESWAIDNLRVGVVGGEPVSGSATFEYTPAATDVGLRIVEAAISDGTSIVRQEWVVKVTLPDGDGDGWSENVDCNDTDPAVHPGVFEVLGNGKDDDCNPATGDTGLASFERLEAFSVPVGLGQSVISRTVLEKGVTYRLHASGAFSVSGSVADAEYVVPAPGAAALDHCSGDTASIDIGLAIDEPDQFQTGRKLPFWGPFNPSHTYTIDYVGQGAPIRFNYHDCDPRRNSGSVNVEIFAPRGRPVAPLVNAGPDVAGVTDRALALAPAAFMDDAGPHVARVDWGDGSELEGGTLAESSTSGTVSASHIYRTAGTYTVTVTVTDADGLSGRDAFTVSVAPGNLRPRLVTGTVSMREGGVHTAPVLAIDPEGDPVTLEAIGLPPYAAFTDLGAGLGALELAPGDDHDASIEVRACDAAGCTSQPLVLAVSNVPPLAASSNNGPAAPGATVTVSAAQADPGTDTFEYAFDCEGDGSFEAFVASSVATCTFAAPGSYGVDVQVRDDDGGIGLARTTVVVVSNLTATRTAVSGAPNPALFGSSVTFTASVAPQAPATTTPTGSVSFAANGTLLGAPAPLVGGVATLTTSSLQSGLHTITADYSGDDEHQASTASTTQTVTIAADAGADVSVDEGGPVRLDGSASRGTSLSFEWLQISGPRVVLSDPVSDRPTFTAPLLPGGIGGPEALTLGLTVRDAAGQSVSDTVTVTVSNLNHAPVAHAGADVAADEGARIALSGAGSDPDGDAVVSFQWAQTSGPAAAITGADTAAPEIVVPAVGPDAATLAFQLTVSDGALFSLPETVLVTVRNVNDPPSCAAAYASPAEIWPPNHALVPVGIEGVGDPNGDDFTIAVTSVTQDEPLDATGDGDTTPDAVVHGNRVQVRAERAGSGNGRVYVVSFTVDDGNGGSCAGSVAVGVPHSQKPGPAAVDDGQHYVSTTP